MTRAGTPVDVAVGVLLKSDASFLLASRPEGKPYAGYWEFPGGKVEPGESVANALARELHEELGINLGTVHPWVVREFVYPHAYVRLHFCRVFEWTGTLTAREGQHFDFFAVDRLPQGPLLPATIPVLRWLSLPVTYAISDVERWGEHEFLRRLEHRLQRGLLQVLWRELELVDEEGLFREALKRVRAAGARMVVSSRHPRLWWASADGVQLTADDLAQASERPDCPWVGASVHARSELDRAIDLKLDFAVLGPIKPTTSHPGARPLGWKGFSELSTGTSIPVYAIGGLDESDFLDAWTHGAHGIATRSAAWAGAD